ncbi:MAG TPA: nucleotide exchange factor GrpE [bacterium]|nr:nucleotide exchange factor GrpE [bacterium]
MDKEQKQKEVKKNNKEEKEDTRIKEVNVDYKDTALRALADLDNYKKRVNEEKEGFVQFATLNIINDFLPIYNQLQQAIAHIPDDQKNIGWVKGVVIIANQFKEVLKSYNIEQYDVIGKEFDHNTMEAVIIEKDNTKPDNIVLKEVEPGYMMNGKIVKYAKVVVNKLN